MKRKSVELLTSKENPIWQWILDDFFTDESRHLKKQRSESTEEGWIYQKTCQQWEIINENRTKINTYSINQRETTRISGKQN